MSKKHEQGRRKEGVYGYARVSTSEQDLSVQLDALRAAGCDLIREEKVSGTSRKGRSELEPVDFR